MRRSLLLVPLLALPLSARAQVLITEFQNDPTSSNDDGEWIEIQNLGTASVAIGGWSINDYSGSSATGESTTRWTFPTGAGLQAGQVIVVAKFASANGYAENTPANLFVTPASYECATAAHDDAAVPNMTPVGGTSGIALSNSATGDAVVLRNSLGAVVDSVEYGTVDRDVPGLPATPGGSATSLRRVGITGSSVVDFAIAATPDPFVGFTIGGPTPPVIAGTTSVPRHVLHGAAFTVSATISDGDGVAAAAVHLATASSTLGAASAAYVATAMAPTGRVYAATPALGLPGTPPATFHERYLRYWVSAEDTATATASDPSMATDDPNNTRFTWRNVMPLAISPISEVRAQDSTGLRYRLHSARVEGVALTRRVAFVNGRPNFFIQEIGGADAIRVFSSAMIATDVNPGDRVQVTGMIDTFNGVRQIGEPDIEVQVVGTATVPMTDHTIADLVANGEALESQLVRVRGVMLSPAIAQWPSDGNATIDDGTGTLNVRVAAIVDLAGTAAPAGSFDIVGILGQFASSNVGGYQLMPRAIGDVTGGVAVDAGVAMDSGGGDGGVVVNDDAGATDDAAAADDAAATDDAASADATVAPDAAPGADAASGADAAAGRDATAAADAGSRPGSDAGPGISQRDDSGCGCEVADRDTGSGPAAALALGFVALGWLRRRRG